MLDPFEEEAQSSRVQEALLAVLGGILLSFALLVVLGFSEPTVYRSSAFLMTAAIGASIGLAIHLVFRMGAPLGLEPLTRRQAVGRLIAHVFAGWLAMLGTLLVVSVPRGGMSFLLRPLPNFLAVGIYGGLGIVAGLLLSLYQRQQASLRNSDIRLKESEFAQRELELARALQERLLPPSEIKGSGYRITARNYAARYVAGDFYDIFRRADGSLGLVIADVAGKGMAASLIMASTKAMIPLLTQDRPIAEALAELNRRLASQLGRKEFVALLLAAYEPREGRLVFSNAGLPDPYLLSPGGRLRSLEVPGPRYPLGIRSEIAYRSLELSVGRGERVLFFTDGLPEASVAPGEPLGYERLAGILALNQSTGGDWLDGFVSEVEDATSSEREDDWTVLLLERELEPSVAR